MSSCDAEPHRKIYESEGPAVPLLLDSPSRNAIDKTQRLWRIVHTLRIIKKGNPEAGEGKLANGTGMWNLGTEGGKRGNIYSKDGLKGGRKVESWPRNQTW